MSADETTTESKINLKDCGTQKMYLLPPEEVMIAGLDFGDKTHSQYDDRIYLPLQENSILNVMVKGVIDPVHIMRDGERYIVVAGRQRIRRAREANIRLAAQGDPTIKVKCILLQTDAKSAFGVNLTTNEDRQNDNPLAKARKIQHALDMGMSWSEVAGHCSLSEQRVRKIYKLLELSPKIQKKIESGKVSSSAAYALIGLSEQEQVAALADAEQEEATGGKKISNTTLKKKVTGDTVTMRTHKVIQDKLAHMEESSGNAHAIWALKWVLGLED